MLIAKPTPKILRRASSHPRLALAIAVIAATPALPTAAQGSLPEVAQIEEVTVYAQRREQQVRDVPITISAFDNGFLNRTGIVELDALSDLTPGLVIQEQSPNNPGFVIRGITSDSGSAQAAPRVSVYYNGVDVSRSRGSYFELYDIERVEVVKGPQATLFGTASSVGAVSVYTNRPQQETAAALTASVGNYGATELRGFVNGGTDLVQVRVAGSFRQRDGFIDNIAGAAGSQTAGGYRQDDMQAIERTSIRPSIRFTPSDRLTVDLVYTYEDNDDSGTSFKNGIYPPTGGDTSPFSFVEMAGSPFSREVLGKRGLGIEREVQDLNLRVEWDISDSLSLTSITAGRSFESLEVFDADGTQAWFLEFAEDAEGDQFSQELRLVGESNRLSYILGANYFTEDGSQAVPFSTEESIYLNCVGALGAAVPCINADGSVNVLTPILTGGAAEILPYQLSFANYGENEVFSVFADATYAVNDRLELTAGARYVSEERTSGFSAVAPDSVLAGAPLLPVVNTGGVIVEASGDFDDVLPRFNALYRVSDDLNVYATISKGRRSDVIDVVATLDAAGNPVPEVVEVPAEIVWNYEAGVKGNTAAGRVTYTASVYYQDYSDFQVTLQDETGDFFTANAGSATNYGAEADVRALLGERWELFANVAFIDAEIDDDSSNGNLAGNRFRLQPEWATSAGVFYNGPLSGDLGLTGAAIYSYRSDVFFEPENAPIAGLDISQDGYGLLSLRLGIESSSQRWSLIAFANNVLDEEYLVDAGNTGGSFGNPTFVAGPPLFYGLQFNIAFGD